MKYLKMTIMALLLLTVVHATTQTKKYVTCMIHDRVQGIKFNYYYTDCGTFKMDMLLVDEKYMKVLDDNTFLWHGAMIPMETLEEFDKKVKRHNKVPVYSTTQQHVQKRTSKYLPVKPMFAYAYVGAFDNEYLGFHSKANKDGLVLTSTGVLYNIKGYGAGTEYVEKGFYKNKQGFILYLGKECDAYSKLYGDGRWAWANGGFVVEFKTKRIGFGRQEINMNHIPNMNMGKCQI